MLRSCTAASPVKSCWCLCMRLCQNPGCSIARLGRSRFEPSYPQRLVSACACALQRWKLLQVKLEECTRLQTNMYTSPSSLTRSVAIVGQISPDVGLVRPDNAVRVHHSQAQYMYCFVGINCGYMLAIHHASMKSDSGSAD
jgi:hypothetical protein